MVVSSKKDDDFDDSATTLCEEEEEEKHARFGGVDDGVFWRSTRCRPIRRADDASGRLARVWSGRHPPEELVRIMRRARRRLGSNNCHECTGRREDDDEEEDGGRPTKSPTPHPTRWGEK